MKTPAYGVLFDFNKKGNDELEFQKELLKQEKLKAWAQKQIKENERKLAEQKRARERDREEMNQQMAIEELHMQIWLKDEKVKKMLEDEKRQNLEKLNKEGVYDNFIWN